MGLHRDRERRRLRPSPEGLETRRVPAAFGLPWLDPRHLSLSFVPDGTAIAGHASSLFGSLDVGQPNASWQQEVLRAFQTWAVRSNLNLGLVPDSGAPLGTSGKTQRDPRFGDVRVGAHKMTPEALSVSVPGDPIFSGTLSGDVLINSNTPFGDDGTDLFAVMLHEAGHVLGLDHSDDPTSVMFSHLNGLRELSPADVAALQDLYGTRPQDEYDREAPNDSRRGASAMEVPTGYRGATPLLAFGDLTTPVDSDHFQFQAPDQYNGPVAIRLQTDGISLMSPRLTVMDHSGRILGVARSARRSGDVVEVVLGKVAPGTTYVVKVEGSTRDDFAIGGYGLAVSFEGRNIVPDDTLDEVLRGAFGEIEADDLEELLLDPTGTLLNADDHTDDDASSSVQLVTTPGYPRASRYEATASLSNPSDVDYFRLDAPDARKGGGRVMTVTLRAIDSPGVLPRVTVLDERDRPVSGQVLANGNGTFTLQVAGVESSRRYYIKADSKDGSIGNYGLEVTFSQTAAVPDVFASDTLGGADPRTRDYDLYIGEAQLFQFLLAADSTSAPPGSTVTMTILNAASVPVGSLGVEVGQVVSGEAAFLTPGPYTVRFSAVGPGGSSAPSLGFQLFGGSLSGPIGPALEDPTLTPIYKQPTALPVYRYPGGVVTSKPYYLVKRTPSG